MKLIFTNPLAKSGAIIALAMAGILGGGAAHAAGTLSNTDITNISLLSYTVGGTPQNQICSAPGVGNSTSTGTTTATIANCTGGGSGAGSYTTFKVDNKVNLLVSEGSYNGTALVNTGAVTNVTPGTSTQVTSFVVTNTGNTAQGYTLSAANQTSSSLAILGTLDSFDVTINSVVVDANNNGMYEAGDTATSIVSLAPDASVTVFVLATIPLGATNGQQANITLTAKTVEATTGNAVAATVVADNPAAVDILFADAATVELGFVGASSARDGQATARDAYRISSAVISVLKTSTLMCDPFNGDTGFPKSIPGSIVRWTITISNASTATASATLAQVTDTLNTNTTFDNNLVTGVGGAATAATTCTSAGGALEAGGVSGSGFKIVMGGTAARSGTSGTFPRFLTTGANADGATHSGGIVTIDYGQALPAGGSYNAGELKSGESVTVYFNVTIN